MAEEYLICNFINSLHASTHGKRYLKNDAFFTKFKILQTKKKTLRHSRKLNRVSLWMTFCIVISPTIFCLVHFFTVVFRVSYKLTSSLTALHRNPKIFIEKKYNNIITGLNKEKIGF